LFSSEHITEELGKKHTCITKTINTLLTELSAQPIQMRIHSRKIHIQGR